MNKNLLDKETILKATEDVIRHFGPDKASIADVAKELKVSHAAIYRYFDGKTALWNAITEHWLTQIQAPISDLLMENNPADVKLLYLLKGFAETKRRSAINDPEMFANYMKLFSVSTEVIRKHKEEAISYIEDVIVQGIADGIFFSEAPHQAAIAAYLAMSVFVYPDSFKDQNREQNINSVIDLLIRGLKNPEK